jgi:gliding motility associated protien GldN
MNKLFCYLIVGFITLLSLSSYSQVLENNPPRDGIYDKMNILSKVPVPYTFVREADILWQKRIWRVIDMREKLNQPFYYPLAPHNQWRSLMQVILDALKEGTIIAYEAPIGGTDEFTLPLNYNELIKTFEIRKVEKFQRTSPPYDYYDTVVVTEFKPTDVKMFRIKEDWFFDKQRSQMDVRILGICPIVDDYDENGNYRGIKPMFWIYFPEARTVFAKSEVFNRHNSSQRLTYDDVFWKRMFSSYIYKEDNVFDRKISDYAAGMDAILESERIKNEMFQYEQDLWEY